MTREERRRHNVTQARAALAAMTPQQRAAIVFLSATRHRRSR